MIFKDSIAKDIDIFLNLDEFGEIHDINGQEIPCIFISLTQQMSGNSNQNFNGLQGDFRVLYYRTESINIRFQEGESIRIDSARFTINRVENTMGITKIEISSYRGRGL